MLLCSAGASRLEESQPALRVSSPSPPGLRAALGWNVALWIRSLGRGNQLPLSSKPALCEILKEETHLQEAFPSPAARKLPSLTRCCQLSCCTPACLLLHVPPWIAFACLSCSVVLVCTKFCSSLFPPNSAFLSVSLISCYNLLGAPNETSSLHLPLACLASSSVASRRALAVLQPPRRPPCGCQCDWRPVP